MNLSIARLTQYGVNPFIVNFSNPSTPTIASASFIFISVVVAAAAIFADDILVCCCCCCISRTDNFAYELFLSAVYSESVCTCVFYTEFHSASKPTCPTTPRLLECFALAVVERTKY